MTATLFVLLLGANLPAPLYATYQRKFGFSTTVLTLIFATYAIVLIPSLLVFGQLSDRVGRKRVLLGALAASALGLVLFAAARNTTWLFAARAAQGLAVGSASATAIAALVEVDPDHDEGRAALGSVVGNAGGAATAPLLAGALAEWAPWPQVLCYLITLLGVLAVGAAVSQLPERHPPGGRWRLQRPSVPAQARSQFTHASITGMSVWIVGALYLSVVPSYTAELLDVDNLAVLALPTTAMLATACVTHALSLRSRRSLPGLQLTGLALLVGSAALLVVAWTLHSLTVLMLAAVVAGGSLGLGFGASQTEINQLAPTDHRGEVTAAYVMVVYTGITVASLVVGRLGDTYGITRAVAIAAGAVAIGAIGASWSRLRPAP
jgi:MFS family permease